MWKAGALIGAILGWMAGDFEAMLAGALLGAILGKAVSILRLNTSPQRTSLDDQDDYERLAQEAVPVTLQQRVEQLERRLRQVEHELAQLQRAPTLVPTQAPSVAPIEAAAEQSRSAVVPGEQDDALAVAAKTGSQPVIVATPSNAAAVLTSAPDAPVLAASPAAEADPWAAFGAPISALSPEPIQTQPAPSLPPGQHRDPQRATPRAGQVTLPTGTRDQAPPLTASKPSKPASPPKSWRERLPAPIAALVFGGNTVAKVGVLILFLGLAFLLRYAADRVSVPVEFRYAGVALTGTVLLALGWWLRTRRRDFALVLQGAGIGVFYLTTLAAMKLHPLLPPAVGFSVLAIVAAMGAVLAIVQNAATLAILGALGGFAAPVLASTGSNQPIGLFSYLAVLDCAIAAIAWFKAWRVLNLIALSGTLTLAAGWGQKHYTDAQFPIVQPFLLLFFVLFALIGLMVARRTLLDSNAQHAGAQPDALTSGNLADRAKASLQRVGRVDSALVFGAPISAFGLQYLITSHMDYGPAWSAVGFAAFYLVLARLVLGTRHAGLRLLGEAYAIVGTIFITLAIPLALEGRWTGAAWAVEAAGMYWLGIRQQRRYARGFALLVLVGAAYKLLGNTQLDLSPGTPLLQGSWIGPLLMAAGAMAIFGLHRLAALHRTDLTDQSPESAQSAQAASARHAPTMSTSTPDAGRWARAEALAARAVPWLGLGALGMLLWQVLSPLPASAATAVLALLADRLSAWLDRRCAQHATWRLAVTPSLHNSLRGLISSLQAVAVLAFAVSQHRLGSATTPSLIGDAAQNAAPLLSQGWIGALCAVVIALSLLVTVASPLVQMRRAMLTTATRGNLANAAGNHGIKPPINDGINIAHASNRDQAPTWQARHAVVAVTAAALLHVAMLFGMSADAAARLWPLSGLLVLFAGLWLALPPLAWAGLALQPLALVLTLVWGASDPATLTSATSPATTPPGPLMDGDFWRSLAMAMAGLVAGYGLHTEKRRLILGTSSSVTPSVADWFGWRSVPANRWTMTPIWHPLLVGWGLIWWLAAWLLEGERSLAHSPLQAYWPALQVAVLVISSALLTGVAHRLRWQAAKTWTLPTVLGLWWVLLTSTTLVEHPLQHLGWLLWPLAALWSYKLLLQQQRWLDATGSDAPGSDAPGSDAHRADAADDSLLATAIPQLHVLTLWLWTLLATFETRYWLGRIDPSATLSSATGSPPGQAAPTTALNLLQHPFSDTDGWSLLGWVLPMLVVLWGLRSPRWIARWPLAAYPTAYQQLAALPLAMWTLSWFWGADWLSAGHAWPLPYVPLLNPLDLSLAGALIVLSAWWRCLPSQHPLQQHRRLALTVLALSALAWVTGMALRGCHHLGHVAWSVDAMLHSRLAQAALSITWALSGVLAMVAGHKTVQRQIWLAGTALLALVVAKLFLVDLADHGGLYRIVSFLGVGVLMLVVGYFAPVPPAQTGTDSSTKSSTTGSDHPGERAA